MEARSQESGAVKHLHNEPDPRFCRQIRASSAMDHGVRTPDKDEVPGSSSGSPTMKSPAVTGDSRFCWRRSVLSRSMH